MWQHVTDSSGMSLPDHKSSIIARFLYNKENVHF